MIVIPLGDQFKKNDLEASGCMWRARGVNLEERDYLEDIDEDGRIILKLMFKKKLGGRGMT